MEKKKVYVAPECEKVLIGLFENVAEEVALPVASEYDQDNFSKKYNPVGEEFEDEEDPWD